MTFQDVRWMQRLEHFQKAIFQLGEGVALAKQRKLSNLEEQGIIQAFEYTHELAWKTMKDFLESRGVSNLYGSKDTSRAAFQSELIENGDLWMEMIGSRNLSSHTYNEKTAAQISSAVIQYYYPAFCALEEKLTALKKAETP